MLKRISFLFFLLFLIINISAQQPSGSILAPAPPMGWMTWNYFGENINEKLVKEMADAMAQNGMLNAGYEYLMIDDGWQGGRDKKNNLIPDVEKFPSGIKALADYVHSKGLKLGIYSDAAPLTCAGYTASFGFEEQDAKTFAMWGIDYLKYDYCNAPKDVKTAIARYRAMADALQKCGRKIVFAVCEWGVRGPWLWAAQQGAQLWRTTYDVRDAWSSVMEIYGQNVTLYPYAGPGHWNDPDMLIVGLRGSKGPAGLYGGIGCTDIEYQTNMSLWSMMAAPLIATNDIRSMHERTKNILLNKDVIAINQDVLGKQAERKIKDSVFDVLLKPLRGGDFALAILNHSDHAHEITIDFNTLGLQGSYEIKDLWRKDEMGIAKKWKGNVLSHETKLLRLQKIK